ncbi:type A chloramphenicol O-acetyltransferase [Thomasclavelia spiroformis]|uniref:type A chloramphenicol O-acetyltransferase n=1 Tax=Thomasclavelia spiroformis TaxID=29348 RepID=UPI00399B84C2
MEFKLIDKDNWKRKEYFDHYFFNVPCTYSMTVKMDITKIIKKKQKLYPTMLYYITTVVNKYEEFKMTIDEKGRLGMFDTMLPSYTIFHQDTKTFSNLWMEYYCKYEDFCKAYEDDMLKYANQRGLFVTANVLKNNFPVSMILWTLFKGSNLNFQKSYGFLQSIFTMGKYYKENDKILLPLAIQVHHAVCDGFHICRFVNELQELLNS